MTALLDTMPELVCVHCLRAIDTSGNYASDPPAHVYCAFQARPMSATGNAHDDELQRWREQLTWLGYVICGGREFAATTAETPYRVGWDIPAAERTNPAAGPHCGWLVIAETPCPGDPSTSWPEPPANGAYLCREKHAHPMPWRHPLATTSDLQPQVA